MQNRPLRDASANERSRLAFRIEYCRNRVTAAFTDYDYNLALAVLVPGETAVAAVFFLISRFDIAAELAAINVNLFAFTTERRPVCLAVLAEKQFRR